MAEVGKEETEVRAAATIGGAPISWVAIIGALMGAGTMVPLVYYVEGGGYHPLSKALYVPVVAILGPIGGVAAITIGGIIALFIAPGAASAFLVSLAFDYILLATVIGLILNGQWKWCIPLWIIGTLVYALFPWFIPGPAFVNAVGLVGPYDFYPLFIAANWFDLSSILVILIFRNLIPKWIRSDDSKLMVLAICLTVWGSEISHLYGWGAWAIIYSSPAELIAILSAVSVPLERTVLAFVGSLVGVPLIKTLRKSGLRSIPNSAW
ncbi:MAG: hypothetical protein ACTSW4_04060 [Candidatus Ranarchaeia archaeon]